MALLRVGDEAVGPPCFEGHGPQGVEERCVIMAADAGTSEGCVPIRAIRSIPARTVLAIGSESRGLSEPVLDAATVRFTIPLKPGVESLNAAAATAIALFQLSGLPVEGGKA